MSSIERLIHEIHRRSLWQVLGIFLGASWLVLQVVEVLTETAGLPDWTPSMALVLLLVGLPICLATAFVQEGLPGQHVAESEGDTAPSEPAGNLAAGTGSLDRPSTRPSAARRLLTWRNAIRGGAASALLLGVSVAGYFFLWSSGIGPVGNLVAQGVIDEGVTVVLADFEDATDEGLGDVVTEALRVDLGEAAVLDLVDRSRLNPALERMQLAPGGPITAQVAQELAIREGLGVVLEGEVSSAGAGYILTASLIEAQSARTVASFRVTASGESEIIGAIDQLSQDIREKSGESLRDIRAGEPLAQVTTASLEALRAYSEARRLRPTAQSGRELDLLEQAVAADSTFAIAWLALSVHLFNRAQDVERAHEAIAAAYRHREPLNETLRYMIEGNYAFYTEDRDAAIAAYQAMLGSDPGNPIALNQLANIYANIGEAEQARDIFRQGLEGPVFEPILAANLVRAELFLGNIEAASQVLIELEREVPELLPIHELKINLALVAGATDRADSIASELYEDPTRPPFVRMTAAIGLAKVSYRRGRIEDGRVYFDRAVEFAGQVDPGLAAGTVVTGVIAEMMVLTQSEDATARLLGVLESGALSLDFLPSAVADGVVMLLGIAGVSYADALEALGGESASPAVTESFARSSGFFSDAPEDAVQSVEEFQDAFACRTDHCSRTIRAYAAVRVEDWDTAVSLYEGNLGRGAEFMSGVEDLTAILALPRAYEGAGRTADAIAASQRVIDLWADADEIGMVVVRNNQERIARLGGG